MHEICSIVSTKGRLRYQMIVGMTEGGSQKSEIQDMYLRINNGRIKQSDHCLEVTEEDKDLLFDSGVIVNQHLESISNLGKTQCHW